MEEMIMVVRDLDEYSEFVEAQCCSCSELDCGYICCDSECKRRNVDVCRLCWDKAVTVTVIKDDAEREAYKTELRESGELFDHEKYTSKKYEAYFLEDDEEL